jgi:hypothetical protein
MASSELGYYNSSGDFLQSENEILTKLNLKTGYNFKANKNTGKIDFQLHPEIYGFENKLQTIKIALSGFYSHFGKKFDWTFRVAANKYFFSGNIADFSYDSFLLSTEFFYPFKSQINLKAKTGFAYRNFNHRDANTLDMLFAEIDYVYAYNSYLKLGLGLYLEKFDLKNKYNYSLSIEDKNRGIRFGPIFRFSYARNFIFSVDYQFLIHDSDKTIYPSYDQWLRIIGGKSIIKNISAFILIDYYKRDFEYQEGNDIVDILYSPVNAENRIYLKLSFTVKDNQKLYLKAGYFDEELFYRGFSLSGWKSLIGFEIKG